MFWCCCHDALKVMHLLIGPLLLLDGETKAFGGGLL